MVRELNRKTAWEAFSSVRMPPQNIEAEISVLGSLLLDGSIVDQIADALSPDAFYKTEHRLI